MVASNSLIMVFIGLEISSIATYILCGYLRDDKRANESALKYFLLGSFATAFFLYGVAIIYGAAGSTNVGDIRQSLTSASAPTAAMVGIAMALMFVGLAFKVSGAPFQIWAPRCLSGRAHAGHGFHVGRTESRSLRHFHPYLHDGFPIPQRHVGTHGLALRSAQHDHRQLCGAHAEQRQAHDGLQFPSHMPAMFWSRSPRVPKSARPRPCFIWPHTPA